MEPILDVTQSDLADALSEWKRRYDEEPERFQSEAEFHADAPDSYGAGAAKYLVAILAEQREAAQTSTAKDYGAVTREAAGL